MSTVKMIPVSSSAVAALGFAFYPGKSKRTDKGDVSVKFRSGKTYRYLGVPMTEFLDLFEAGSIGRRLSVIKKKYPFSRV